MTDLDFFSKKLVFVMGKGGVGKTTFSTALANLLSNRGKKVLLCHVLQLENKEQVLEQKNENLWEITLNSKECFKEYIILKIKFKGLYSLFLGNKITEYLQKAAPGVKEMVLLGKLWFEREHYDHVIIDMPSTGYALTMLHTPFNFANLFPGGPIYHDSKEMIQTFSDPNLSSFTVLSLAEEMPIQESLALSEELKSLMPKNPPKIVFNRLLNLPESLDPKKDTESKVLISALEHLKRKESSQKELLSNFKNVESTICLPEIPEIEETDRVEGIMGHLR